MRIILSSVLTVLFIVTSCAQDKKMNKDDLQSQEQKVSYAIGHDIGKNFKTQGMEISIAEFVQGLKDGIADSSLFTDEEIYAIITQYQQEMTAKRDAKNQVLASKNQKEGEEFLAANSNKDGFVTTESGLQYKVVKKGNGPKPTPTDKVTVHYKGSFINGEAFDSSYDRNEPTTFPVNGVIKGWQEALQLMSPGAKYELVIPYNLAYGERGKAPVIEPYQTLLFEVELIKISE